MLIIDSLLMPSAREIREQIARESHYRARLAVPAFGGGFLYLLSAIIITATLNGAPTVGLVQALTPALSGEANPPVSPRAAEVKYFSHHAFALIAGSTLAGIAIAVLTLILLLLLYATRFRRPSTWVLARPLILFGGIALALLNVGHQVVSSIETHSFSVGHDHSSHAVNRALTEGTANVGIEYLDLLAALALAAGMIGVLVNAYRVGLIPRWMSILGIFAGVLILVPIGGATLEVVPAFWMVMMGVLYGGRWPNGEPPAWGAGEARPWPSPAQQRAEKQAGDGQPALAMAAADVAPTPAQPATSGSSRKRRRKRGARG